MKFEFGKIVCAGLSLVSMSFAGYLVGEGTDLTGNPQQELVVMPNIGVQNAVNAGSSLFYRMHGLIALADVNFSYNPWESGLWSVVAGPSGFYGRAMIGFEPGSDKLVQVEEKWVLSSERTHSGNTTTTTTSYHTYKIPEHSTLSPTISVGVQPWLKAGISEDYDGVEYKPMLGLHLLSYQYYDIHWKPTDERAIKAGAFPIEENKKQITDIGLLASADFSAFGFLGGRKQLTRDKNGTWGGTLWDVGIFLESDLESFYMLLRWSYVFTWQPMGSSAK